MSGAFVVGGVVAGFLVIRAAANRFAARQRRMGRWDENGPIYPTRGPWGGRGMMGERLEVTGQYVPRPIEQELPSAHDRPRDE